MAEEVKKKKDYPGRDNDQKIPAPNSPDSKHYAAFKMGGMKAVKEAAAKTKS